MKTRFLLAAGAVALAAGAADAQVYSATSQPYCREFTRVVNVGGRAQNAYGQACMQPDGSWQIVSDQIPATQPVEYYPAQNRVVYVPQPEPSSVFSFSFNSWSPYRTRYYNDYGHRWRDWGGHDNGNHRGWDHDRGPGHDHDGRHH